MWCDPKEHDVLGLAAWIWKKTKGAGKDWED